MNSNFVCFHNFIIYLQETAARLWRNSPAVQEGQTKKKLQLLQYKPYVPEVQRGAARHNGSV